MSLSPGTRLGPYEITALLGAGGMGEVYRATDTSLKRQVAIKVLPDAVAADPERLARFQREAEVLASLNHPNIAAIHGLERSTGVIALVMELVEGPTLADRIAHGALPTGEALAIAKQIAEALEAAHEQGIVHRDLKPANIKVREDGTVKVLDFGLAKALGPDTASTAAAALSQAPTITSPALVSQAGVIMGTAAYMSPEQAKGRTVDRRADIWAFGCVLYEMLTGTRAFPGDDVAETLAAVIKSEPVWTTAPQRLRRLLQVCLEKDPRRRLQAIGDARLLWEGIDGAPTDALSLRSRTPAVAWATAALLAASTLALGFVHFREPAATTPELTTVHLSIPDEVFPLRVGIISPDGRKIVFPGIGKYGVRRLWLRTLDAPSVRQIPGTDGATGTRPFWSPDSRFVAFEANSTLKKVDIVGGPPQTICAVPFSVLGGSWNRDGVIVFGNNNGPVMKVPSAGGNAAPATVQSGNVPSFFPDGRHFIYLSGGRVFVRALDASASDKDLALTGSVAAPALAPSTDLDRRRHRAALEP
jgi:serine/threonine protein kinase